MRRRAINTYLTQTYGILPGLCQWSNVAASLDLSLSPPVISSLPGTTISLNRKNILGSSVYGPDELLLTKSLLFSLKHVCSFLPCQYTANLRRHKRPAGNNPVPHQLKTIQDVDSTGAEFQPSLLLVSHVRVHKTSLTCNN